MKWVAILEFNPLIKIDQRIREELSKLEAIVVGDKDKKEEFDKLVKNL